MSYSVQISSRGTITIPKEIRDDLNSSKILIIKQGNGYLFKAVTKVTKLGKSLKTNKKLTDKDIQQIKANTFLKARNIY